MGLYNFLRFLVGSLEIRWEDVKVWIASINISCIRMKWVSCMLSCS